MLEDEATDALADSDHGEVPTAPSPAVEAAVASSSNGSNAKPDNNQNAAHDKRWLENFNLLKPCIMNDGSVDYSSLDEETQKRMQNFVKDQRKCYRKRESHPDEPNPMTQNRVWLLNSAKFNFKPSDTLKALAQEKKQAKSMAKEKKAAVELQKISSWKSGTPVAESATSAEKTASTKRPTPAKAKKSTPPEACDSSSDCKMPAAKSPKQYSGTFSTTPSVERDCVEIDDSDDDLDDDSAKKPPAATKKSTPLKTDDASSDGKTPAKKSSKPRSSTSTPASRKRSGKPTYLEMTHEAIVALKDRTGSSAPAISKWILANNEHAKSIPPNMFKSRLNLSIKQGVNDGRFTKIKGSYKINSEWMKKQREAARSIEVAKKKAEKQRQNDIDRLKQQKMEESAKMEAEEEKKRKKVESESTPEEMEEARRKKQLKEEAEARKKYIEQQLRKRRFPIEDSRLHNEDKEWGVKPPARVAKRPALPHTLTCLIPPHLRSNAPKKYQGAVVNASSSGNGTLLGGGCDRGLITDAIHVYHFFCGDVGLIDVEHPVPKFSLKTLLYALDEVLNGNAKAAKSLPPLLTHLFVTALRMLTTPQLVDNNDADLLPVDLRLQEDLSKLREGLNAVSWSQICFFYMDVMERYYTSDVSLEDGVLPGDDKFDMRYYWDTNETEEEKMETEPTNNGGDGNELFSNKYKSYLGDSQGVLVKGYSKLQQQKEPWTLKAEELMALLRALTDDVLAKRPDLAEDIAGRGAKLNELSKEKRAATMKYNKVRLAYEGPKKPSRSKKSEGNDEKGDSKEDEQADAEPKEESDKPFVPTATKQQFVSAEKAYNKAVDAYEAGLNKLVSRTEPIGFDRNFNAIYFFQHDPVMLHVEQLKQSLVPPEIKNIGAELTPFSSWHFIDTKPLFEQFLESLDDRGQREDETLKICSSLTMLKRRLQDDKKENNRAAAREREKEELERRLENAKSACDAEDGRRSGRLAGIAVEDLKKTEEEIKILAKAHEAEELHEKLGREQASDYSLLTGLKLVTDFFAGQRTTRSIKKSDKEGQNEAELLANVPSHKLWMDDRIGGNGTLRVLAEALTALEKKCNDLSPWEREDITREAWRKQLNDASCAWAIDCVMQMGPSADEEDSNDGNDSNTSPYKKHYAEQTSGSSYANLVTTVKVCLKDLETRIFAGKSLYSFIVTRMWLNCADGYCVMSTESHLTRAPPIAMVVSGKKRSTEEADLTGEDEDASSYEDDDKELTKRRNSWKIKISALKRIPTQRYGLIRDIIVAAITVARKSHLSQVAADLKSALQLFRPYAGGEARSAAIKVLEKHGGYDGSDDEGDDFEELAAANTGEPNPDDNTDAAIASLLCDEYRMINGSLGGDNFADKTDWSDAIKDCKSVSRLAVMVQTFVSKADAVLEQLKEERNNLDGILGLNAKRSSRSKSGIKNHDSSTQIWCNAKLTDKLVKARVKGYPWWPAHICTPLDVIVAGALEGSGYCLISSVGNEGMFMVSDNDVIDFSEETGDDLTQYDKSTLEDLHESMAIAKKLWRHRNRGMASPWSKKSRLSLMVEEKKSD